MTPELSAVSEHPSGGYATSHISYGTSNYGNSYGDHGYSSHDRESLPRDDKPRSILKNKV